MIKRSMEAKLWQVTAEVDDYFRRLGGSGCYPGYCDWHVPALVLLAIDQLVMTDEKQYEFAVRNLISHSMWEKTGGLPTRAINLINVGEFTSDSMAWYVDYVSARYPMKYSSREKDGWKNFLHDRELLLNEQS